jgi:transposase
MRRDQRHTNAYIFGAVCPARDCGAALVLPYANTHAMNLHLKEISKSVASGAHAVVIIDGAGWHIARHLRVPDNLSLLRLPPYSPELNAQENVWQYLRQNYLAGRIFNTYVQIVQACCAAWKALIAEKGRITSIASRPWLNCNGS